VDAVHADVYRVLGGLGKDAPSPEVEGHGAGMWNLDLRGFF
jgi:condensin complex subunit 2